MILQGLTKEIYRTFLVWHKKKSHCWLSLQKTVFQSLSLNLSIFEHNFRPSTWSSFWGISKHYFVNKKIIMKNLILYLYFTSMYFLSNLITILVIEWISYLVVIEWISYLVFIIVLIQTPCVLFRKYINLLVSFFFQIG